MAKKVILLYYSCTLTAATDALASYPGSVKVSVLESLGKRLQTLWFPPKKKLVTADFLAA